MTAILKHIKGCRTELTTQLEKFSNIEWSKDGTPDDIRKMLHTLSKIHTTSRDLRSNLFKHIYDKQS